jgi:hypothetical protein
VCGEVLAEARIDSSTQESFNKTLAQMMRELPPRKAAELNAAIVSLPFAGMTSIKDTPADGVVKLDLKKIDGMTAEQIIDLARRTVTVKLSSVLRPDCRRDLKPRYGPLLLKRRPGRTSRPRPWPGRNGT